MTLRARAPTEELMMKNTKNPKDAKNTKMSSAFTANRWAA
jgi:hypothetical protein